ncbi:MAG: 16S rRNA (adenine(1518)-N(6)/adenine(1519)-N(6))-dimethyltransferase RsmA [Patescibacteria group bacterium]
MDLTNLKDLKILLEKHGIWAKKRFGQNFLINRNIVEKIIKTGEVGEKDTIIEIGPGPGVLTQELCKKAKKVICIEMDREILPLLEETTSEFHNKEILEQDGLNYEPNETNYKLIANLPYNIATAIIRSFMMKKNKPSLMVVMTQLEVAEKMCANPGNMNVLALTIQPFGKPKIAMHVPGSSFYPAPKVTSAILRIEPLDSPLIPENLREKYFQVIHAAFHQKRKMMAAVVAKNLGREKVEIEDALESCGISKTTRPQELSIQNWIDFLKKL